MKNGPRLGLQTFTIRRFLKTSGAIDSAFQKISSVGLHSVELAYVKLKPAYIDALELAGKQHGISFDSSQITFDFLDKQRDWVVRLHEQLQIPRTAVSVLPTGAILGDRSRILEFAAALEQLGAWYRERGLQLCFHHHDFEFRRYGDEIGLDLILDNTSPENLGLELDTYWAQRGGKAPHDLIRALDGRVQVVHLRDYALRRRLFELVPKDVELGAGNLDIVQIIQACREQNVALLAIEQDTATPFESVAQSVEHLSSLGFGGMLGQPGTSS